MFRESGTSLLITGKAWCLPPLSWLIGADFKGGLSPSSTPTEHTLTFFFFVSSNPGYRASANNTARDKWGIHPPRYFLPARRPTWPVVYDSTNYHDSRTVLANEEGE